MKTMIKGLFAGALLLGVGAMNAADAARAAGCSTCPYFKATIEGVAAGATAYGYNSYVETDASPAAKFRTGAVLVAALHVARLYSEAPCKFYSTIGGLVAGAATMYGINYLSPYVAQYAAAQTASTSTDASSDASSKNRAAMMMKSAGK